MRGFIYLISFENTNDIYIGKTIQDINERLKKHKSSDDSSVYYHMKANDISNAYIDIIDSIDMTEDLSHLKNKYDDYKIQHYNLNNFKLSTLEMFHIHNYISDAKYNVINKKIHCKSIVNSYHDMFFL